MNLREIVRETESGNWNAKGKWIVVFSAFDFSIVTWFRWPGTTFESCKRCSKIVLRFSRCEVFNFNLFVFFFLVSSLMIRYFSFVLASMFFLSNHGAQFCVLCKYDLMYFNMSCIPPALQSFIPILIQCIPLDVCVCDTGLLVFFLTFGCWIDRRKRNTNMFSLLQRLEYHTPMSFEQALAMGRTGVLPTPAINGYKPKGLGAGLPSGRHSDSDEEDWC